MNRDDDEQPSNLIRFPRIGYAPPPAPPAPAPDDSPETEPATTDPAAAPAAGTLALPPRPRRSPLDVVSELHSPGLSTPLFDDDTATPAAQAGLIPGTFLPGPDTDTRGGQPPVYRQHLGALSMAAALAVAVACLRGIHTFVRARRENREQRQAVERAARSGAGGSGGSGASGRRGGGRVQSGPEFGRKHLGRKNTGPGSGGRGGSGAGGRGRPGRGGGAGRPGSGKGPASKDKTTRNRPMPGRKNRGGSGGDAGARKDSSSKKSQGGGIHRSSQGGLRKALDRARRKQLDRGGKGGKADLAKRSDRRPGTRKDKTADRHGPKNRRRNEQHAGKDRLRKNQQGNGNRRTTLGQAISQEAERRMKLRRKTMTPPLWTVRKGDPTTGSTKTKTSAKTSKAREGGRGYWSRAQASARDYWQRRTNPAGATGAGFTGPAGATGTDAGAGGGWDFGTRRRSTPWESAAKATAHAAAYTVTLDRLDDPTDPAHGERTPAGALNAPRLGLGPAPEKNFPRPGTRRPRPMPYIPAPGPGLKGNRMPSLSSPGRLPSSRNVPGMDAQHQTEVTLDDVCDLLEELTAESFDTHDKCKDLAARAYRLRERLLTLSLDLAVTHNVIGELTSAAMASLAEDMEILAQQSEAMSVESLHAAEATETANNAMEDAYRPITQAAADAGLLAPSAPVHNQS